MLFTEADLQMNIDPFSILDETVYLTEDESKRHPQTIPIIENQRIGMNVVGYRDLISIVEGYGIGLEDAIIMVSTCCQTDPSKVVVSIDESDVIEDPSVLTEEIPYVIAPLSKADNEAIYTKIVLEALTENGISFDEELCIRLLTEETYEQLAKMLNILQDQRNNRGNPFTNDEKKEWKKLIRQVHPDLHRSKVDASSSTINQIKDFISKMGGIRQNSSPVRNPSPKPEKWDAVSHYLNTACKAYAGFTLGSLAVQGGMYAYAYKNRPKSFIAKRIAALRSIYQKMLFDAKIHPEKAGIIKKAASIVLGVVDKLLAVLQRTADGRLKGFATPAVM